MKERILVILLCLTIFSLPAQNKLTFTIKDSTTNELIVGAIVKIKSTTHGAISSPQGTAVLNELQNGEQTFVVSMLGYNEKELSTILPLKDSSEILIIFLSSTGQNLDEVIVSTTRTNSRIDDLPTKVEVLGQEDMDEESALVPGTVSGILGDLSIINIQHTSPVNGNEAIRMQGLDSKYTQIMRDGFPLYGGFSGSLGVLSIPPLDLKQVEIIKGSASTLYGGGAIGGLINFISKTPADTPYATITLNVTSLKEVDFNAFASLKGKKTGFTVFAGSNLKQAADINGDGFTEVPADQNFTLHPRLFFEINKKTQLTIGLSSNLDNRSGGDLIAINKGVDSIHRFLEKENIFRNSADLSLRNQHSKMQSFTFKAAGSSFQRNLNNSGFIFNATQYSFYNEINDAITLKKHTIVAGINYTGEVLIIDKSDAPLFNNYNYATTGCFVQDDWQTFKKLSFQAGLRYDHHNVFGDFVLPRISVFYKPAQKLSIRIAAGTGYKTPNMFDLSDPSVNLCSVSRNTLPESSYGVNTDISYHTVLFGRVNAIIDQAFYYTTIQHPVILATDSSNNLISENGNFIVNSYGTDTYLRFTYEEIELYLGYNHTESMQQYSSVAYNMPFNPKDKFSATLAYEIEAKWRFGIEASYTSNQYITNNKKVHDLLFMAAMLERKFKRGSIVLNCENLLDERQSRYENLVEGTISTPVFKPIWGSLEGRVLNLSLKINL
jgi:outer membrane receptor for ferrienterochelin and colicins